MRPAGLIDMQNVDNLIVERDRGQKAQRAYSALERLLRRALEPTFTGTGSVELDVKQGGITTVRVQTKEVV